MTLLDLTSAICVFTPIGTALGSLRPAHRSWFAYTLAIVVGGLVGFIFAWVMRSVTFYYGSQLSEKQGESWYVGVIILVGMFVWVIAAAGLGDWLTQVLLGYL